jgi:hypothetical protein
VRARAPRRGPIRPPACTRPRAPTLAARPARRPKEIKEIRDFLQTARRKDARSVKVMTQKDKKVRRALRRRP